MSNKDELEQLGLSEKQAEIYLILLRKGSLRISEITQSLQIPRSSVYENLKELFNLGLAEEIIENNYKMIKAYPISSLNHGIQERIEELKRQTQGLDKLERALARLSGSKAIGAPIIRSYRGRSGARQIFWNSLKAKGTAYIYSDYGRARYLGKKFYESFVTESNKRDVKEKVLMNTSPTTWESIKRLNYPPVSPLARTKVENIRFLDQKYLDIKGDSLIYDNIYAQVYLKNVEITGFEIESTQFADTQRSFYKILWGMAQPLPPTLSETEKGDANFEDIDDPHVGILPLNK